MIRSRLIGYLTCNIGYWNFENNRSINWLFGESAQHYTIPHASSRVTGLLERVAIYLKIYQCLI